MLAKPAFLVTMAGTMTRTARLRLTSGGSSRSIEYGYDVYDRKDICSTENVYLSMADYDIQNSIAFMGQFETASKSPGEDEASLGLHDRDEYLDNDKRLRGTPSQGHLQIASPLLPRAKRYSKYGYLVSMVFSESTPAFEKRVGETVSTIHCRADYYGTKNGAADFVLRNPDREDDTRRLALMDLVIDTLPGDDPLHVVDASKDKIRRSHPPHDSVGLELTLTHSPHWFED